MSWNLAPTPKQWAYAQLCRRWFTHYPDPFLRGTTPHVAIQTRNEAVVRYADMLGPGNFTAALSEHECWAMPNRAYWETLSVRQRQGGRKAMPREESHEQLATLMVSCAEDNWDGHGASKISFGAVQHATWWLRQLPADVPNPVAGVSTAGNVTLDWLGRNGHMVVVSCKANGDLSYAWANGEGTTALGTFASPMEWPEAILQLLRLLNGREVRRS